MAGQVSSSQLPGRRPHALREGLHFDLKQTLVPEDYEAFRASFQDLPEHYHLSLYELYKQVLHLIRANSEAEFDNIVEEAQLWSKLNTLEQLCEEQGVLDAPSEAGQILPRVQPSATARSCRVHAKQQELEHLRRILQQTEAHNATLMQGVAAKQAQILEAAEKFKPVVEELSKVHGASRQWANRSSMSQIRA